MKKIVIKANQSGKRIDKFLSKEIFCNEEFSRGEIIREIKAGNILVNDKKSKPSYTLKEGDKIRVEIGDRERELVLFPNPKIKIKIIFENNDFLVIDKPAGIQVHPVKYPPRRIASSPLFNGVNPDPENNTNTVVNWLIARYPKIKNVHDPLTKSGQAELRPGIVHRLDKETSGVMVIAKDQKTFNALKKLFQTRKVEKTYLAIVRGVLQDKAGIIEKPLAKAANYKKQIIASMRTKTKIRSAMTEYKVVKEMGDYSLLEVHPKTGRTHQIRIHLRSIGHPVVGDKIYGIRNDKKDTAVARQLLHAKEIRFSLFGKKHHFSSNLPGDFKRFTKMQKERF